MNKHNLLNFDKIIAYKIIMSVQKLKINKKIELNDFNIISKYQSDFVSFSTLNNLEQKITRSVNNKLTIPFYAKTIGQRKYNYWAAQLYNMLPTSITEIVNIKLFKIKLKNYLCLNEINSFEHFF